MTDRSSEMESGHREPGIIVSAKEEPPPRVHGTPGRRWDLARLGPAVRTSEPRAESFLGPVGYAPSGFPSHPSALRELVGTAADQARQDKDMTDSADSAQPVFSRRSTARVSTDRPSRYGKQLASHMGRKITTTWDEASQTGSLTFDREGVATGAVELSCHDDILQLDLAAGDAHLERLEQVTGIHLARFGAKEGLVVSWLRQDGAAGTTQGPLTPEDLERMRAEREARQASS